MTDPEFPALLDMVNGLVEETRKGSFQWTPVNPSTYVWERPRTPLLRGARMILQGVEKVVQETPAERMAKKTFVILQVFEITPAGQEMRLKIDGSEIPQANDRLQELYRLANSGVSEKGLDFLKALIDKK